MTASPDSKSPDKKSSKDRKSRRDTTDADSAGGNRSSDSTATTDTTTATTAPTSTTATTRPTPTTRPTATTAPRRTATTATTAPATTETTAVATTETTEDDTTGQYHGGPPYEATEAPTDDSATTTSGPPGRAANAPASRSGSGMPPGVYPVGPGAKTANSSPAPATAPASIAPVVPLPDPVVPAESQPDQATTSSTVAGTADGNTAESPGSEVRNANRVTSESPAPPRGSEQLGQTGDGTRRLIIFGGVALLMGAVVVAFTGREGPRLVAAASPPVGPTRRPRPRQEIDGWEDGIPLAPVKRELARHRLGISASWYSDDEPEA